MEARTLSLPVLDPLQVNAEEVLDHLRDLRPDLMVVASYGQILKAPLLALPALGCVNLHASLLPAWRGAAPVAHALLAGDPVTGVTLMQMDAGLDTGPLLATSRTSITEEDDRGLLTARLATLAAEMLISNLTDLHAGRLVPQPQDNSLATLAPRLHKSDGLLDWQLTAREVVRRVQAFSPRPGAFTFIADRRILVRQAVTAEGLTAPEGPPGTVAAGEGHAAVLVRCGAGTVLRLLQVQPAGRGSMAAADAMRGRQFSPGDVFAASSPD
jgi:methionyl-tRNA formyltransferase